MKHKSEAITFRSALKTLFFTFVFDTIIAIFLKAIKSADGFATLFIISQCIGLSSCFCVLLVYNFIQKTKPVYQAILVGMALVVGTTIGSFIWLAISGQSSSDPFEKYGFLQLLFLGLIFGSVIAYIFSSRERIASTEAQIQQEKIKRLTSENKAAEANLKLLQAQIEPHFLFNTLSNVLSLLDTEPQKGKSMLLDFIQYLRASLSKLREEQATLGQEIEMIKAYLNMIKVRMGKRLNYKIDLSEKLEAISFPPMLLQPLVENAIKHGLESRIDGGEILISGTEKDGILRLEVVDNGIGFTEERESGMGLSNVRERLHALYGESGRLILNENQPHGVKAVIEVPHGKP